jgi:NADPH:quinone reductase-like Zn-dependent oxidoreductase
MKAVRIHEFGDPSVLRYEETPTPEPAEDQILIKVHVAGVNPVDGKIRSGKFPRFHPTFPAILGRDFSGVIERVGSRVKDWKPGDEVFGMPDYTRGTYAEYAVATSGEIARKPSGLDHLHAGAIPVAGLTAWQALFDYGELRAGQRVLIHGAGGGVGHFAVQFALAQGAEVVATASPADVNFVRELGVEKVIDYKAQRFEDETRAIDLVLDLIGGKTRDRSWQVLKPGGMLVSTLGEPEPPAGVRGKGVIGQMKSDQLTEIAARAASGKLRIEVSKIFPLAEARQAHEHMEKEHSQGKTVLRVRD